MSDQGCRKCCLVTYQIGDGFSHNLVNLEIVNLVVFGNFLGIECFP